MSGYAYASDRLEAPALGLVVLQTDETIEGDFRRMVAPEVPLHVSRVPSGLQVTPGTLQEMEGHLTAAAALLPAAPRYGAVGYGCTSGTATIGAAQIAARVRAGVRTEAVSEPVSALIAACGHLGVTRLALLSPYVAEVSAQLRQVLAAAGIGTPVFGSFDEAEEAKVVRIDAGSIRAAALDLLRQGGAEAVFLSCTNLRTMDVIGPLEAAAGLPVLSSNQVLAWHMGRLSGAPVSGPGRLFQPEA